MTEAEIDGALCQLGSSARALTGAGGNSDSHPAADEELFGSTPLHSSLLVPRSPAAAGKPGSPAAPAAASQVVCQALCVTARVTCTCIVGICPGKPGGNPRKIDGILLNVPS